LHVNKNLPSFRASTEKAALRLILPLFVHGAWRWYQSQCHKIIFLVSSCHTMSEKFNSYEYLSEEVKKGARRWQVKASRKKWRCALYFQGVIYLKVS
jgi:hypothetical protein